MRRSKLLNSTAFRTALLYAVLFGASVLILFAVVYWQTAGYMQRQLRDVVTTDLQSLAASYREDGFAGVRAAIRARLPAPPGDTARYLLLDRDGKVAAGNLPAMRINTGWAEIQDPKQVYGGDDEGDERGTVLGRGLYFKDGSQLFVGQGAYQLTELRELLFNAFGWGLLVTLLLAGAGGAIMGRRTRRQIGAINQVAGEIVRGNLAHRIAAQGMDNEFELLAQHLNRMLERIETLMESMRQVTNDIAHDLRTPLGRLRQRLESLRSSATTVAEYQSAVDGAIVETDAILATFGALLGIAQIEAGSRRARFTEVNLSVLLDDVLEIYTPVAEENNHSLQATIDPGIAVHGDRDLLTQLFANLVENALRHTPAGTRVAIELTAAPDGALAVVADDGPGVPQEARTKVLQRFYRLEEARSSPGSGLGLSLVAAIAELHGAELQLRDNHPGLRIELHFPATRQ